MPPPIHQPPAKHAPGSPPASAPAGSSTSPHTPAATTVSGSPPAGSPTSPPAPTPAENGSVLIDGVSYTPAQIAAIAAALPAPVALDRISVIGAASMVAYSLASGHPTDQVNAIGELADAIGLPIGTTHRIVLAAGCRCRHTRFSRCRSRLRHRSRRSDYASMVSVAIRLRSTPHARRVLRRACGVESND